VKGPKEVPGGPVSEAKIRDGFDRTEVQFAPFAFFEGFGGQRITQGNAEGSESEGWRRREHY